MITVKIVWEGAGEQKKTFDSIPTAVDWCRRNYNHIGWINNYYTGYERVNIFDLAHMLEKGDKE